MKERNLEYEQKFRTYLFSFDLETHKEICKNINVKHNQNPKFNLYKIFFQDLKRGKLRTLLNTSEDSYKQNLKVIQQAEKDKKATIIFNGITKDKSDLENYYKAKNHEEQKNDN